LIWKRGGEHGVVVDVLSKGRFTATAKEGMIEWGRKGARVQPRCGTWEKRGHRASLSEGGEKGRPEYRSRGGSRGLTTLKRGPQLGDKRKGAPYA